MKDKHHKSDMPMNRLSNFPKIQQERCSATVKLYDNLRPIGPPHEAFKQRLQTFNHSPTTKKSSSFEKVHWNHWVYER